MSWIGAESSKFMALNAAYIAKKYIFLSIFVFQYKRIINNHNLEHLIEI